MQPTQTTVEPGKKPTSFAMPAHRAYRARAARLIEKSKYGSALTWLLKFSPVAKKQFLKVNCC